MRLLFQIRSTNCLFSLMVTLLVCIGPAFGQPATAPTTPTSTPSEVANTSIAIANDLTTVTQMRASIVRAFGKELVSSSGLDEALVDADPRYRDNLISGLKSGIVPGVSLGAYRPYIWGGKNTADYPYVVAVVGTREICSGVVLNGNIVLTAAHCFCNNTIRAVYTGAAVFRGVAISVVDTPRAIDSGDCGSGRGRADVGLLYLPLATMLPSARLATQAELVSLSTRRPNVLRLVGYGLTKDGGLGVKNYVDLPVASTYCAGSIPLSAGLVSDADYYGCLVNRELVAGAVGLDVDACGGDSGAPLILEDGASAFVVAIASRSVSRRRSCGDGAVYALCDADVLSFVRSAVAERP